MKIEYKITNISKPLCRVDKTLFSNDFSYQKVGIQIIYIIGMLGNFSIRMKDLKNRKVCRF